MKVSIKKPQSIFLYFTLAVALCLISQAIKPQTVLARSVRIDTTVYFDEESSEIKPKYYTKLDLFAKSLDTALNKDNVKLDAVTIEGTIDSIEKSKKLLELDQVRAEKVKEYLIKQGVPSDLIKIYATDATRPLGNNNTEEGRARNRRVDVKPCIGDC